MDGAQQTAHAAAAFVLDEGDADGSQSKAVELPCAAASSTRPLELVDDRAEREQYCCELFARPVVHKTVKCKRAIGNCRTFFEDSRRSGASVALHIRWAVTANTTGNRPARLTKTLTRRTRRIGSRKKIQPVWYPVARGTRTRSGVGQQVDLDPHPDLARRPECVTSITCPLG